MWAKTNPKIISDNLPVSLPICKLKKDLVKQVLWDVNGYRHFEFINSDMKTDVQSLTIVNTDINGIGSQM